MTRIQHVRSALALHDLGGSGAAPPLLLLHALGGSAREWGEAAARWPGRVCALDFSGHGQSEALPGGGYMPELFAADADAALAAIGGAALAGAGLGAYVALLLAGARRELVPAALLLPGRGLDGGGAQPDFDRAWLKPLTPADNPPLPDGCDPILCALEYDPRPPDYAVRFGTAARRVLLLEDGTARPPWWIAQRPHASAVDGDPFVAMARAILDR